MRLTFLVLVVLLLPTLVALPADGSSSDYDGLLITAVMPVHSSEFVILTNTGDRTMDLGGLIVTDGEGTLWLPAGTILGPGDELVIASGEQTFLDMEGRSLLLIQDLERRGSFILADRGDWVHIIDGDEVLDTFVYGDVDRLLPGWEGPPFPRLGRCEMAVRNPGEDTDSRLDWSVCVPGRSSFPDTEHMAEVRGFVFPEEGYSDIMWALQSARNSIAISLYQMDNSSIMGLLADMARAGVEVSILLEGQPVGGFPEAVAARLMYMVEAGCDIHILRSTDGYKRYSYMHAKYAVIDGGRFIVTSENWRTSAFENNRGWGVVGYSDSLGRHLLELHGRDGDPSRHDVHCLSLYYSYLEPVPSSMHMPPPPQCTLTVLAPVTVNIGPETGTDWLQRPMYDAEDRIYSQQFYCQADWVHGESPLRWMRDAGERGVDSRILLDSTFMGDSQGRNTHVTGIFDSWPGCQGRLWEGGRSFTLQHNKGLIVDDQAVVSSFNWVDHSFRNNRELALTVRSSAVADMFAAAFLEDWCVDPIPPVAVLDWDDRRYRAGETVLLSANRSYDNVAVTQYLWDLNGDGDFELQGSHVLHVFEEGSWECRLRVVDAEGNYDEVHFLIEVDAKDGLGMGAYLPLAGLCLVLAALRARRMLSERREGLTP